MKNNQDNNVITQKLPDSLIRAIQQIPGFVTVYILSKGSGEPLYALKTFSQVETGEVKVVFELVSYGEKSIKEYLRNMYAKKEWEYYDERSLEKLKLFIYELFSENRNCIIKIGSREMLPNGNIDQFLQSIS